MKTQVGIWEAKKEELNKLDQILEEAIAELGGWEKYIKPGDFVLIKPNEFIAAPPQSGKTTHPALVVAVAKACRRAGAARVMIGELNNSIFQNFADYPQINDYAEVVNFGTLSHEHLSLPGARSLKSPVPIPEVVEECDVFINMPGLRTHALPLFSNALKNLMGLLSLGSTSQVHMWGLEGSVIDLNAFRHSDLVIVDAIWSLEGNFPAEGDPKLTEFIMVGDNALAVDMVAAKIMGFGPEEVSYLNEAQSRGLGPESLSEICISGNKKEVLEQGIDFVPAAVDYKKLHSGIRIEDKQICTYCRRAAASGLEAARNSQGFKEPENLLIAHGPIEKLEIRPDEDVLLVGNCTKPHCLLGRTHIPGCPPLAGQVRSALLEMKRRKYRLSYCSIGMRNSPLEEVIHQIGKLGYDGIEIWAPHLEEYLAEKSMDSLLELLASYNLAVPMISPYFNLVGTREELEESYRQSEKAILYAQQLNCPLVRVFTGPASSSSAANWQWKQAILALQRISDQAAEHNLALAVETHQGQLADTVKSTFRLLHQVNKPNFRVNLDIHNLFDLGENPTSAFKQLLPYTWHIHAKNGKYVDGKLKYGIPLAEGNMDWRTLLKVVVAAGYEGFISVEWFGDEALENAKSEMHFLQGNIG